MKKYKPKKKGTAFKVFSWILAILLIAVAAFVIYELYKLNLFPAKLMLPVVCVLGLIAAIVVILQLGFTRSAASKFLLTLVTVVALAVYSVGGYYLNRTSHLFNTITNDSSEVKTTVVVLAMKDSSLTDEKSLNGEKMGVLKDMQQVSTKKMIEDLQNNQIDVSTTEYDNIPALASALYDGEVNAIVMTQASAESFQETAQEGLESSDDEEPAEDSEATASEDKKEDSTVDNGKFKSFLSDTKVVYSMSYTSTKASSTVAVDDITNTPFTVLITGVDSRYGFAEVSRSDVNMLMTVNPQTHIILLTSIPRDYYLETACDPEDGCANGQMDKLTHTGIHGVDTTKKTIEKALGVTINYTVKVNFNTVVELVDAIGGIDVTVEPGYAVSVFNALPGFSVTEGVNHLNGEQALAYSREREAYIEGDRQRGKNQQQVLSAIISKAASPAILTNYANLMNALSDAFITDIDMSDIQDLIQFQLTKNPDWTILTYNLDGSGGTDFCAELGQNAYVMYPDPVTEATAEKKIQAVIDGKSAEEVESVVSDDSETPAKKEVKTTNKEQEASSEQSSTDVPTYSDPTVNAIQGVDEQGNVFYQDSIGQYYYWDEFGNPLYVAYF